jgi:DNA-binding LytR/AlgR family response regulator
MIALGLSPAGFLDDGLFKIVALFSLAVLAEQVIAARRQAVAAPSASFPPGDQRLTLSSPRGEEFVAPDEVLAFVGADDYVEAWLKDGRRLLQRQRLRGLALPRGFLKVHRSAVVNLSHARALVRRGSGGYLIELSSGATTPVSRANLQAVRKALAAQPA